MECFVIFVMAWCWYNATESKPQNVVRQLKKNETDNKKMEIYLIILLTIIGMLILISALKNLFSNEQVKEVKRFIEENNLKTLNTNKAYYSALGLKKDYPTYPAKIFFTVTEKDLIIYGYNKFPFIFKTHLIPFAISLNSESLKEKLKLNRIFELEYISIKNKTIDFKFTDINGINTKVDYQLNFNVEIESEIFEKLKLIESEFKQK